MFRNLSFSGDILGFDGRKSARPFRNGVQFHNVIPLDAIGGLPTRNLQSGRFSGAEAISSEALAEHYLG